MAWIILPFRCAAVLIVVAARRVASLAAAPQADRCVELPNIDGRPLPGIGD